MRRFTSAKKFLFYLGFATGIICLSNPSAFATTFTVTSNGDSATNNTTLRYALTNAAAGDTIIISSVLTGGPTITMGSNYPPIVASLNIMGPGSVVQIDGAGLYQPFFVYSGNVNLSDLAIQNCSAVGGNGGATYETQSGAGGGGLGAGGAIFVNSGATVNVSGVTFQNTSAVGGNSGPVSLIPLQGSTTVAGGSGGGGIRTAGGEPAQNNNGGNGGGGGGALTSAGGNALISTGGTGGNSVNGQAGGDGGNAGEGQTAPTPGSPGNTFGGGGGGGSANGVGSQPDASGAGGMGGFGGGGGGGGGGNQAFGTQVAIFGAAGGTGGYGGGGGGQGAAVTTQSTAAGGFLGGSGGQGTLATNTPNTPGAGGGGAGLGGACFVYQGGTLNINGGQFTGNSATGGQTTSTNANPGTNGTGSGNDLFMMSGSTVTIDPTLAGLSLQAITSDGGSGNILNTQGVGTLTLNGANTFLGTVGVGTGTTIELAAGASLVATATVDGTMIIQPTASANTVNVNSDGTLTDSGTVTTANVSGQMTINSGGAATTVTVASGGSLIDNGTVGTATVSGTMTVGATGSATNVTINTGASLTNSGNVTTLVNSGTVDNESTGTITTLTSNTGPVTNSGTITTASITSETLTNSGTINSAVFNLSNSTNSGSIDTAIINSGSVLTSTGSLGTVTTSGTLNISGPAMNVTVNNGGVINSTPSAVLGIVDILSGGVFNGHPAVTSLTNSGTVNLLNNLLNVGTYTQTSSGVLVANISVNGTGGLIQVAGNANIDGTLDVNADQGLYLNGVTIPIIKTGGMVVGTFSNLVSPQVPLSIGYLTNEVFVTVTQTTLVGGSFPALKGNALNVFNNFFQVDFQNDPCLKQAFLSLPFTSPTVLTKILNELQPVQYQGLSLTTFENIITVREILASRNALVRQFPREMKQSYCQKVCSETETAGFWVSPFGLFIDQNKLQSLRRYHANTYGATMGLDTQITPYGIGGMGIGYSQTQLDWSGDTGRSDFQTGYIGLYGGGFICGSLYFDASLLGSFERYHAFRNISFFHKKAKTKHSGFALDGHMGTGWIHRGCYVWAEPYANIDYVFVQQQKFKEKGASCLDLHVRGNHTNLLRYEFGVNFSKPVEYCSFTFLPSAYISYVRRQILDGNKFTAHFKHQPNSNFNVYGTRVGLDKIAGGASVDLLMFDGNMISIAYDVEYNKKENNQNIIFTFERMY